MQTVHSHVELAPIIDACFAERHRIALVPTMGNLHAGHRSLIAIAREHADVVVATIFVNPTQFGANEDFARYPRTLDADLQELTGAGCDIAYAPTIDDIYPFGIEATARIAVPGITKMLEGAIRPGHFDGVATVVAKLFNQVRPGIAVFGQKDYQQLLVIQRMTEDLGYPIEIVAAPIVREASGLAMSSRNQYLDAGEHSRAAAIAATLAWMGERVARDTHSIADIETAATEHLRAAGLDVDYAVLRRADDLAAVGANDDRLVALIAARAGRTRLIDNRLVSRYSGL